MICTYRLSQPSLQAGHRIAAASHDFPEQPTWIGVFAQVRAMWGLGVDNIRTCMAVTLPKYRSEYRVGPAQPKLRSTHIRNRSSLDFESTGTAMKLRLRHFTQLSSGHGTNFAEYELGYCYWKALVDYRQFQFAARSRGQFCFCAATSHTRPLYHDLSGRQQQNDLSNHSLGRTCYVRASAKQTLWRLRNMQKKN